MCTSIQSFDEDIQRKLQDAFPFSYYSYINLCTNKRNSMNLEQISELNKNPIKLNGINIYIKQKIEETSITPTLLTTLISSTLKFKTFYENLIKYYKIPSYNVLVE